MNTLKKVALCALLLMPFALMATDSKSFDTTALDTQADAIKNFLFDTRIKVVGMFGVFFWLFQASIISLGDTKISKHLNGVCDG